MEKSLTDLGDKISEDEKAKVTAKIEELKKVKDGDDIEAIKKAQEELTQEFYAISQKMYAEANPQGAQGAEGATGAGNADDNVVDADFKVDDK